MELPIEVWEQVLQTSVLSPSDVCNVSQSCRYLYGLLRSARLWSSKFAQTWYGLYVEFCNAHLHSADLEWSDLFKRRFVYKKKTNVLLKELCTRFSHSKAPYITYSLFVGFHELLDSDPFGDKFVLDELRSILKDVNRKSNLTNRFYAEHALRYVLRCQLRPLLRNWVTENGPLEYGALLFAQWCQPELALLHTNWFDQFLHNAAEKTKQRLHQINSSHPVLLAGPNAFDGVNLTASCWHVNQCQEIIKALNYVFAEALNFGGNLDEYYKVENSFLNKVIESRMGIPITLSVLYHAIAKRLGVFVHPVGFPGHFLLKIEAVNSAANSEFLFIDCFNGCCMLTKTQTLSLLPEPVDIAEHEHIFEAVPFISVLLRMLANIVSITERYDVIQQSLLTSVLEMQLVIQPDDVITKMMLARCYLHMEINTAEVIELMQSISAEDDSMLASRKAHFIEVARAKLAAAETQESEEQHSSPKCRSDEPNSHVKYAVGMVMRHKEFGYRCVISGWDNICSASCDWKQTMGVHHLARSDHQPFYHVLVDDGTNRYAAEDNLLLDPELIPEEINHPEVGKYFDEFKDFFYKPNDMLAIQYPEDLSFVTDLFEKLVISVSKQ